jgi:outer membrane protein OmpA-like peptidoglycan-associated protein
MQDNIIPASSVPESQDVRLFANEDKSTISVTDNDLSLILAELGRLKRSPLPLYIYIEMNEYTSGELAARSLVKMYEREASFEIKKVDESLELSSANDISAVFRAYQVAPCSEAEFRSDHIFFDSGSSSIRGDQRLKLFSKRSYIGQLMAQNDRCVLIYVSGYMDSSDLSIDEIDFGRRRASNVISHLGLDENSSILLWDEEAGASADGNRRVECSFLAASPSSVQGDEFAISPLNIDMVEEWLGQQSLSQRTLDMDEYFTALLRRAASIKKHIQNHPNDMIIINGYGTGGDSLSNLSTGVYRASAAMEWLVSIGVKQNHLTAFSYGQWDLLTDAATFDRYIRFVVMPEASIDDQYKQPPYFEDIYFKENSIEPTDEGWQALLRIAICGALGLSLTNEFIAAAPDEQTFDNSIYITGYVSADEGAMLNGNRYNSLDYNRACCVESLIGMAFSFGYNFGGSYVYLSNSSGGVDGENDGSDPAPHRKCTISGVYASSQTFSPPSAHSSRATTSSRQAMISCISR